MIGCSRFAFRSWCSKETGWCTDCQISELVLSFGYCLIHLPNVSVHCPSWEISLFDWVGIWLYVWFSSSFLKPFPFIYKGKILSERPNELVMPCGFILVCVHSLFTCFMEIYRFILPSNTLSSSTDREIKFLLFTFTQKTFSKNFPAFLSKYALDLYFTQIMSIGGETLNLNFYEPYLDTVPLLFPLIKNNDRSVPIIMWHVWEL